MHCPVLFLVLLAVLPACVRGHGRLISPPSRSSAWRYGFPVPPNYQDNELFCGGFAVSWRSLYLQMSNT